MCQNVKGNGDFLSDLKPETSELEFEGLCWNYTDTEAQIIEMKAN
jgi:hypothetical protein